MMLDVFVELLNQVMDAQLHIDSMMSVVFSPRSRHAQQYQRHSDEQIHSLCVFECIHQKDSHA